MRKIASVILIIGLVLGLSACADVPQLTPGQQEMFVEYSAALLLKYARNYDYGLVAIELPEIEPPVEEEPPEVAADLDDDNPGDDGGGAGGSAQAAPDAWVPQDLGEVIGIEGLEFRYAGFDVADEYPPLDSSDVFYFVFTASPGTKLLVIRFDVVNSGGTDIYLDMANRDMRIWMGYNGGDVAYALTTLLPDDLAYFQGPIAAGATVGLSSIREIPASDAGGVVSLEYVIRTEDGLFRLSY